GLPPERLVEAVVQLACLGPQPGALATAPKDLVDVGHPLLCVIDVSLELAQRERKRRKRAVGVRNGVAGILPALVVVAVRRAGLVLLETVVVSVARLVDPAHRRLGIGEV